MAILKIRYAPDPILKQPTQPIPTVTAEIRRLAQDMVETMHAAGGVGLSANQVGVPRQLFVANHDHERGQELIVLNPVIVTRRGRLRLEEGCLSLPGISAIVSRAAAVTITGMTLDGKPCTLEGRELLARIFQHEIDHLNGTLFTDRISWLVRQRLVRRYQRQQRELARVAR